MKTVKPLPNGLPGAPKIATLLLPALALLLATTTPGQAQSGTWTLTGAGLWSGTGNWLGGTVADGTGNTATFASAGATTVHLDSARTIGNLTFNAGAGTYLIDNNGSGANILTLDAATPTINIAASTTATISLEISGASGLAKAGSGTLVLSGVNTYSGTTSISGGSAGSIQVNSNAALGSSTLLLNGANGGIRYGAAFNDLRDITFGASGGRVDTNGFDVTYSSTFSGSIAGGSNFTKVGNGTLTLAGTNTVIGAGGVNVSGGFLQIDSNARLGAGSGPLTLNTTSGGIRYGAAFNDLRAITLGTSGGTLDTNGFDVTYSSVISSTGAGALKKAGEGALSLDGANTYTGATQVNVGSLLINGNQSAATGAVTVGLATTPLVTATLGGNGTIGGAVSVNANGILAPGTAGDSTTTLSLAAKNLTMSNINSKISLDIEGTAAGSFDKIAGIDVFALNGDITLTLTGTYSTASWDVFDFASKTGNFDTITLAGSYSGSLTRSGDLWTNSDIGGQEWQFDQSTGILSVVPEPSTSALALGALGTAALLARRRRSCEGVYRC